MKRATLWVFEGYVGMPMKVEGNAFVWKSGSGGLDRITPEPEGWQVGSSGVQDVETKKFGKGSFEVEGPRPRGKVAER